MSDVELNSRKKFIDDAQNSINGKMNMGAFHECFLTTRCLAVKNGINSKEVMRKIEEDERRSKTGIRDSTDEKSALSGQVY